MRDGSAVASLRRCLLSKPPPLLHRLPSGGLVTGRPTCPTPALQIALACAVSAVIGAHLTGEFVIADSTYTSSCALSMQSNSICVAGYATTALTICAQLVVIGTQCAAADGQLTKYGFTGPLLSILGFIWWVGYSAAATQAANQASHWTLEASLDPYRTGDIVRQRLQLQQPDAGLAAFDVPAADCACTLLHAPLKCLQLSWP